MMDEKQQGYFIFLNIKLFITNIFYYILNYYYLMYCY